MISLFTKDPRLVMSLIFNSQEPLPVKSTATARWKEVEVGVGKFNCVPGPSEKEFLSGVHGPFTPGELSAVTTP